MWKPILTVATLALAPQSARAWIASNGLVVTPRSPTTFEVPWRGRSSIRAFWCAAGDYVKRDLNLRGTTRIYRTSPVPRHAGQSLRFSLTPENAQHSGLAVIGSPLGLRAGHARTFC